MDVKAIALLGIPFNGDGTPPARENPAAALRDAGLILSLRSRGVDAKDHGDIDIPPFDGRRDPETQVLNLSAWMETSKAAAERVRQILQDQRFLVVLGGDCSILLGIFGALSHDPGTLGLVFLDGHTDYRTPEASDSGEPADIELAVLSGRGPSRLVGMFEKQPLVSEDRIVVFGFRDPDLIAESGIRRFDRRALSEIGIAQAAREGIAYLGPSKPLWLHFDVDVLDPEVMPVNFPLADGLSVQETEEFLSTCLSQDGFLGMSVACFHPALDPSGVATEKLISLLTAVLSGDGTVWGRYCLRVHDGPPADVHRWA